MSPDGRFFAVGGHQLPTELYSTSNQNLIYRYPLNKGVAQLIFSPDSSRLSMLDYDNSVHTVKTSDPSQYQQIFKVGHTLREMRYLAKRKYLAIRFLGDAISVYDLSGRKIYELTSKLSNIQVPEFSARWEIRSGLLIRRQRCH